MRIELQSKKAKLKTAGKFVEEDIEVAAKLQSKNVTPTESPQTVNTDSGFSGIDKVEVGAIPSDYVGSAVTRKGETTYTPTTTDQEIASGQYLSGKQVIKGDSNLVAENIAKGQTIFGVTGTHEGGIQPEGTMLIKQNGVYDVKTIAEVDVQVETPVAPQPDPPVFGFATFNENGEYNAEDYGVDGWSSVKVEVAGSGGEYNIETIIDGDEQELIITKATGGGGSGNTALISIIDRSVETLSANDLAGVSKLGYYAIAQCLNLKSVVVPSSITDLGHYALAENTALESVIFENGIEAFTGQGVCLRCTALNNVVLPNTLKDTGYATFSYATALKTIELPQSLETIGNRSFQNTGLTTITIPSGVTNIIDRAFYGCASLTEMKIEATTPPTLAETDSISSATTTIYIPAGTLSAYQSASNWSNFASMFVEV